MKKFTKILIALGAAGIAKYIYDHVDIVTNEEFSEKTFMTDYSKGLIALKVIMIKKARVIIQ